MQRVRAKCAYLLVLLSTTWALAQQDLDHETHAWPRVTLVLGSGDSEALFGQMMALWMREGGGPFPTILAQEPGPIDLAGGLRLLPNEVPPRAEPPDLLVIANRGTLEPSDLFLAYLRRCLGMGTRIWVVGRFPEAFLELELAPGEEMLRLEPEELGEALRQYCDH